MKQLHGSKQQWSNEPRLPTPKLSHASRLSGKPGQQADVAAGHVSRTWPSAQSQPKTWAAQPSQSEQLNAKIKAARHLQEMELLLQRHHREMDCVHLSQLCMQLVKSPAAMSQLGSRPRRELQLFMGTLSAAILDRAGAMQPRHSSTLLWALGKLALQPVTPNGSSGATTPLKRLLHPGASQGPARQPWHGDEPAATGPEDDAAVASEQQPLGPDHFGAAAAALTARLAATAAAAAGRDVAQGLYGAAQQGQQPSERQLATLLCRMQAALPGCHSQDLSMCIHALASLKRCPSPGWVAAFLSSTQLKLPTCSCQALSNIAWGLATLQQRPEPAWLAAFLEASTHCIGLFSNQELTVAVWALSKMGAAPEAQWMSMIEAEAIARAWTMNNKDLSLLLSALAQFGHKPSQSFLAELSGQLLARSSRGEDALPSGSTQAGIEGGTHDESGETRRATAVPEQHHGSRGWPQGSAGLAATGLGGQKLPAAVPVSQAAVRLDARTSCDVLTSLVRLQVVPSQAVLDSLLSDLAPSLASMTAGDMAALLHALGRLHHRPRKRWLASFVRLLRLRLPGMCGSQLAGTLWSLARLGVRPEDRWMEWVLLECHRKLPGFGSQELANTAWALARLGYRPPRRWLVSFFHHSLLKLRVFKMKELAMMADAVARSRFMPPQPWVLKMHAELAARMEAVEEDPAGVENVMGGQGDEVAAKTNLGPWSADGSGHAVLLYHKEAYSVLRALARIDAGIGGRMPAPASSVPCEGALLLAANMASLELIRGR